MTDRENHTTSNGVKLTIADQNPDQVCVMMYDHRSGPSGHVGMILPTSRLLAMIDTIAPDALRSYLRERSDLIDGPGEPLTVNGANMTAEEYLDAVPEADSPEYVDERPTPATIERLALLEQIRDLYPNLPPSRHIGVVHWLLEGTVLIERVERLLDRSAR